MTMERYIRLIAGTFILASVALGYWVSPWFFLFTAFVGANLLPSVCFHEVVPDGGHPGQVRRQAVRWVIIAVQGTDPK